MKTDNLSDNLLTKIYHIFYRIIMPLVTIFLLLGLSQFVERRVLFGNISDFIIRLLLTIFFIMIYRNIPYLSTKNRIFKLKNYSKDELDNVEKVYYIFLAIVNWFFFTFGTFLILRYFLPNFGELNYILAILNGCICGIPVIAKYEVIKV